MSPELIAILGVGIALAGMIWQGQRSLRTDLGARIEEVNRNLGARMDRIEARMDRIEARMDGIEGQLRELGERLARLEGKVDFLEAYISGRNERPAPAAE